MSRSQYEDDSAFGALDGIVMGAVDLSLIEQIKHRMANTGKRREDTTHSSGGGIHGHDVSSAHSSGLGAAAKNTADTVVESWWTQLEKPPHNASRDDPALIKQMDYAKIGIAQLYENCSQLSGEWGEPTGSVDSSNGSIALSFTLTKGGHPLTMSGPILDLGQA